MSPIVELSPAEFQQHWPGGPGSGVVLLDVREPAELELARVGGTLDIPMREIPARLAELPAQPIVVMCHAGARSRRVAEYLLAEGFDPVFNLAGGIDAWSREVDSSVPLY